MITKKQRNAMLEAVAKTDLNISDFDLTNPNVTGFIRIVHRPTGSYFEVGESYKGYSVDWQVEGYPKKDFYPQGWNIVLSQIQRWIAAIVEDLEMPDLWEELRRQREFLSRTGYEVSVNTPFTADERARIADQIRKIRELLRENASLTNDQISNVEARLDEAEDAASRIGRKDWLLLFLGVIFTLIISGLLTPETVQHIFEMTIHDLGHLYAKPLGLPSVP